MKSKHLPPVPKTASANRKTNGRAPASSAALATAKQSAKRWKERCSQLEKECEHLRREVAGLASERDDYSELLCDYIFGEEGSEFDIKRLLALLEKQPSLEELIAELSKPDSAVPPSVRNEKKKSRRRGK